MTDPTLAHSLALAGASPQQARKFEALVKARARSVVDAVLADCKPAQYADAKVKVIAQMHWNDHFDECEGHSTNTKLLGLICFEIRRGAQMSIPPSEIHSITGRKSSQEMRKAAAGYLQDQGQQMLMGDFDAVPRALVYMCFETMISFILWGHDGDLPPAGEPDEPTDFVCARRLSTLVTRVRTFSSVRGCARMVQDVFPLLSALEDMQPQDGKAERMQRWITYWEQAKVRSQIRQREE